MLCFTADVTTHSLPTACADIKVAAAVQFDGNNTCLSLGQYTKSRDDTYFSLIDATDPSKGLVINYKYGGLCASGQLSTVNIEVQCANIKYKVISAMESSSCNHDIVMKSQYGCPTVSYIVPFLSSYMIANHSCYWGIGLSHH